MHISFHGLAEGGLLYMTFLNQFVFSFGWVFLFFVYICVCLKLALFKAFWYVDMELLNIFQFLGSLLIFIFPGMFLSITFGSFDLLFIYLSSKFSLQNGLYSLLVRYKVASRNLHSLLTMSINILK